MIGDKVEIELKYPRLNKHVPHHARVPEGLSIERALQIAILYLSWEYEKHNKKKSQASRDWSYELRRSLRILGWLKEEICIDDNTNND